MFDDNNFKNSIDYPPNSCYTSKLQADQPNAMSRRTPYTDQPSSAPPNVLLNLARRRLSGEPIGLFTRPPVDRTGSNTDPSTIVREEMPASVTPPRSGPIGTSQVARQAMRMLANTIAARTMEGLGRLGERISPLGARATAAPSTERPLSPSTEATLPSGPTYQASSPPAPQSAALTQSESAAAGRDEFGSVTPANDPPRPPAFLNELAPPQTPFYQSTTGAPPPFAPVSLSPIAGLLPLLRNIQNQSQLPSSSPSPLLANLFRPDQSPLENAREMARNLTRSAPINAMLTNVLNSGLVNRLFSARTRPEVLSRRSRQIEARRERRARLRRRQIRAQDQSPLSFARLREMNKFPSGAFDFSQVAFGAPILLSLPHFLKADPFYLQQVITTRSVTNYQNKR